LPRITAAGPAEIFELYRYRISKILNRIAKLIFHSLLSFGRPWHVSGAQTPYLSGSPWKVIVVDADNTLWGGVVGEVGAGKVQLDSDRLALQAFLRSQKNHGRLLALVSKNRESDASEVFRSRREMVLQRDDFVDWKVNWEPKSKNIQTIAKELNLGLGSFVFLDDNPMECAEVRAHCPEVMTLLLPADSAQIPEFLKHLWVFDQGKPSAVDDQRTAMYRQQLQRNELRNTTSNFREFRWVAAGS
jgi:FkbH-like protein